MKFKVGELALCIMDASGRYPHTVGRTVRIEGFLGPIGVIAHRIAKTVLIYEGTISGAGVYLFGEEELMKLDPLPEPEVSKETSCPST